MPPASNELELFPGCGFDEHEHREEDRSSGACPARELQDLGQGWPTLLEQGLRYQPGRMLQPNVISQGGQFLSGLPGVETPPPDQNDGDIRSIRLGVLLAYGLRSIQGVSSV